MRVLSRLFRRLFLEALTQTHRGGQLQFFGEYIGLADARRKDHLVRARERLNVPLEPDAEASTGDTSADAGQPT